MIRTSFNTGWSAGPKLPLFAAISGSAELTPVTLPHDVVRDLPRSADSTQGSHTAYFPGGFFEYGKTFDVPGEWRGKTVIVEFEGAYRDATVYLNGDFLAQRPNGYSGFAVRLDPYLEFGAPNTLRVEVRAHEDSRWYSGAGLHRNTHLIVAEPVRVALDGVRITTPDADDERAVVVASTTVENDTARLRTVRVTTRILTSDGVEVAAGTAPVTVLPGEPATVPLRVYVPDPARWSVDTPVLYTAETTLTDGDAVLDTETSTFGIRTLRLDPRHGLRINGRTVKLRGACIHHDNGPLGAAAIARADERRVEILKAAGFNAIRSAHNPISRATLDACDRLGVLVMDETFDIWTQAKSPFDYSLAFPEWWERDVEAMVTKDFNHPSVVLYSIGNEIPDLGRPLGAARGRRLAEKIRALDPTRYVTNAINGLVAALDELGPMMTGAGADVDVNTMMASMGEVMLQLSASELVTRGTEESAAVLDVTGFNYGDSRYPLDRDLFPNRVLVGSETFPAHIDVLWQLVTEHPHVIGDFTWTGWDYLGETGIGRVVYPDTDRGTTGMGAAFPWLTANCGDIDITGHRRTVSYYRETVYGLRDTPYLAVHRPERHGVVARSGPWAWSDSVSSWTWDVPAGSPVTVDVYSDADEVELLVNGRSVGRESAGKPCLMRFETTYEPGEIVAVSYVGGRERARTALRTARGPIRVVGSADRDVIRADDTDLAYVAITLEDADGVVTTAEERDVTVTVTGAGVLAGLGTGRPDAEEPFAATTCRTYDGRALAIVRPTGPGEIRVQIAGESVVVVTAE